ncbi:MAG TPA: ParA family protein [Gammaproteobacteria bacterium]|jgi:chromosome partitioning protein|nr:ParA family protein [Gammaproteobacteria bacterium]
MFAHHHTGTARRIVLVNVKGGCGKTTLATTLAAWYAAAGRSTCLLDMDPQGSSSEWLNMRPADRPPIAGVWAHQRASGLTRSFALRVPPATERLIIDTPAGLTRTQLGDITRGADAVIVPVLPSAFDIRASSRSIGELLLAARTLQRQHRIAVVANRVRRNTHVYDALTRFLNSLTIPFVASLRNTQHYALAAEQGLGIHELDSRRARADKAQWKPLIDWLEGGLAATAPNRPARAPANAPSGRAGTVPACPQPRP